MTMIQAIERILPTKKSRTIAVLSLICVSVLGISLWLILGNNLDQSRRTLDGSVNLVEAQVPLSSGSRTVLAGDVVVVQVYADSMDDVYGYQFDLNYDRDYLEYRKGLYSDINTIHTIFATDKERCLLVGATMIGNTGGFIGREVPVCRIEFISLTGFNLNPDLSSEHITISGVNVVTGDLEYVEDVEGWAVHVIVN